MLEYTFRKKKARLNKKRISVCSETFCDGVGDGGGGVGGTWK